MTVPRTWACVTVGAFEMTYKLPRKKSIAVEGAYIPTLSVVFQQQGSFQHGCVIIATIVHVFHVKKLFSTPYHPSTFVYVQSMGASQIIPIMQHIESS